jgi:hypothetical protein
MYEAPAVKHHHKVTVTLQLPCMLPALAVIIITFLRLCIPAPQSYCQTTTADRYQATVLLYCLFCVMYAPQGRVLYVAPAVKDHHEVTVTFQLPCLRQLYTSKPDHYISHLVGHEGPGSLLAALKVGKHGRDWAHESICLCACYLASAVCALVYTSTCWW